MKKEKNYIVGAFQLTGPNEVDIDLISKEWNKLWVIYRHQRDEGDNYRLCKFYRRGSERLDFKSQISETQAKELVGKLGLMEEFDSVFIRCSSFRRIGYC